MATLARLSDFLVTDADPRELVSPLRECLDRLLPAASAWLVIPAAEPGRVLAWGLASRDPKEEWEGVLSRRPGERAHDAQEPSPVGALLTDERCLRLPLSPQGQDGPLLLLLAENGLPPESLKSDVLSTVVHLLMLFFQKLEHSTVLARAKAQWEKAFDVSGDLFFFHDADGAILRANMAVSTFVGLPIRECIGARCADLFPGLCQGAESSDQEWTHAPTGQAFQASTQTIALERKLATFHVLHEVTQQRKLEALSLEKQQVDLTRKLLEGVAHEIRNPLFAISTLTQALKQCTPDTPESGTYFTAISEEILRVDTLIRHFLFLAYPAGTRSRVRLDVGDLLGEALKLARERWPNLDVGRVRLCLQSSGLSVRGESEALAWTLSDLVENGLSFSAPDTPLEITASEEGGLARITLKDSGPGLSGTDLKKAFEPFFTTRPRHAGLGLPLARTTIQLHGGTLTAAENTPSPGTTFLIALPLDGGTEDERISGGG